MNKSLILFVCLFSNIVIFGGCCKDSSGSKSGSISFETDGRTIKLNGVELNSKVDSNLVLNNKSDALCYEVPKETWDRVFGEGKKSFACKTSFGKNNLFLVKCTNGKYYVCYCNDCAYNTVSIFTRCVEIYFGLFNSSSYVNLFNGCADLEAVYGSVSSFCEAHDTQIKDMFKGCSNLKKIFIVSTYSGSFRKYIESLGLSYNSAAKEFVK